MQHLTSEIDNFNEPKDKLEQIKTQLEKHIGHKVIVWGGGGYHGARVTLEKVELHPSILRGGDGFTLKAFLSHCPKDLSYYDKPGEFDPWLGSWQLSID